MREREKKKNVFYFQEARARLPLPLLFFYVINHRKQKPLRAMRYKLETGRELEKEKRTKSHPHLDNSSATAATPAAKRLPLLFLRAIVLFFLLLLLPVTFVINKKEPE